MQRLVVNFLRLSDVLQVRHVTRALLSTIEDAPKVEVAPEESPVCSYNEWDTLEEVIVGRPQGARIPKLGPEVKATIHKENWPFFGEHAGKPQAPENLHLAIQQSEEFCRVLELEGVKVRRPEIINWGELPDYKTPDFEEGGLHQACPRDSLLIVGTEIIEAAMCWRSRYFETRPLKKLLNEYFEGGARWTVAPKPTMSDEIYREDFPFDDLEARSDWADQGKYVLSEVEPVFDAADVTRCGVDIFVMIGHTTNYSGYIWLKRHLGDQYRVHALTCTDLHCRHIDTTLIPLKPGIFLVNPDKRLMDADALRKLGWKMIEMPSPVGYPTTIFSSKWLAWNTFNIDEERVVVQAKQDGIINFLKKLGMKPIPVDFSACGPIGGGFHCWTVDIRRRGTLQSYSEQ